jgi:hypothetical protein
MVPEALEQRILDFVRNADTDDFGELALALFEQQFENLTSYRRRCAALGSTPSSITDWREIPRVDARESDEYGNSEAGAPPEPTRRAEFQRALVRAALVEICIPGPVWLVIDTRSTANADPVIDALAGEAPTDSLISRGQRLDAKQLRSWLGARQRDRRPVQILTAAAGYASLIELLERRGLKFRLPPGSKALCLTPIRTAAIAFWNDALGPHLGLGPEARRRVLCGQASSTPLLEQTGGPGGSFRLPHWVRVTSRGSGSLAILDLALVDTPAHRIEPVAARVLGEGEGSGGTLVLV